MSNFNEQDQNKTPTQQEQHKEPEKAVDAPHPTSGTSTPETPHLVSGGTGETPTATNQSSQASTERRPVERSKTAGRVGARGTAAMDPQTRQEVARKGGLAVSRNKQHMAEIGRKGGQSVSKNREHMAQIGRKGGAASRGHR